MLNQIRLRACLPLVLLLWLPTVCTGQAIPGFFEPNPADAQYPFYHGVASGDATHEAAVLWTRLSFSDAQLPFAAFGTVDVATDTAFADIVAALPVQTQQSRDWCVKADVGGLEADTWYYYRFRVEIGSVNGPVEHTSVTGRTKTLAAPGTLPACGRWRAAAVSCMNYQSGYFNALARIAERNDLDAVVALGDQIYEYYNPQSVALDYQRFQYPEGECVQGHEYNQRWLTQRLDPDFQAAAQQYPWYMVWDDHEVANEAFADGSQYHNGTPGEYLDRKAAALASFFHWNPIREAPFLDDPASQQLDTYALHCYRGFDVGSLVKLSMLDTRTFRSQWVELVPDILTVAANPAVLEDSATIATLTPLLEALVDTGRTMLGADQKAWLQSTLTPQQMGVWNLFAQQVVFVPVSFVNLDAWGLPPYPLSNPGNGIVDKWDGYQADRNWLIDRFAELSNPVVLTGDIHQEFAFEVPHPNGSFTDVGGVQEGSVATEFTATSVVNDPRIWPVTEAAAQQIIPWLEHGDIDNTLSTGYSVLDFTLERLHVDFMQSSDQWERTPGQYLSTSFEVPAEGAVAEGDPLYFLEEVATLLDASQGCGADQPMTMEDWIGWSPPGWGHPGVPESVFETGLSGDGGLRLWRDAQGRLQSSAPLAEVQWFDARGRRLAGPEGRGPWLVHARSANGHTARQWIR